MAGQPPLPLDCGPEWTAVRGEMKRYEQLAEQIAELIRSGVLAPGERVPSVRQARRCPYNPRLSEERCSAPSMSGVRGSDSLSQRRSPTLSVR